MNGDLVTQVDISSMLEFHAAGRYVGTVGIRRYLHAIPFGRVDREGSLVQRMEEKPTVTIDVNTGIYALAPELVAQVRPSTPQSMPDLLGGAIERGDTVGAFEIQDDWIDVGQREQLDHARGEA